MSSSGVLTTPSGTMYQFFTAGRGFGTVRGGVGARGLGFGVKPSKMFSGSESSSLDSKSKSTAVVSGPTSNDHAVAHILSMLKVCPPVFALVLLASSLYE